MNDVMRLGYRKLGDDEQNQMKTIKELGANMHAYLESLPGHPSRELSLAKTKIEEAVMWGTKHVTAPEA